MGKYDRYDRYSEMQQSSSGVHPIWRGIGCVMFILIPIVAYAAADTFYDSVTGSGLSLFGLMILPGSGIMYRVYFSIPVMGNILRISPFHLVFILVFSIVGFLIFSLAYAIIYRFTGPPKYGPTDSPPVRRTKGRRR